jgi:predicted ATPase
MISLIEAKNFRSIKYISRPLSRFHVLIGGNATGKTTFFDIVGFISDIINARDIDEAIDKRLGGFGNFEDLTHKGEGGDIEFAIELVIPKEIRAQLGNSKGEFIRYNIIFGKHNELFNQYGIKSEKIMEFYFEETKKHISYAIVQNFSTSEPDQYVKHSALNFLYKNERVSFYWLKNYLSKGVQLFTLDSQNMRLPSAPSKGIHFKSDGSNLPWVVDELRKDERRFERWLAHVRTALPDIEDIKTEEIPFNRYKFLVVKYASQEKTTPSWLISDGTLRLLALTLPAYLPNLSGLFLIEEPENGIHPQAIETVYQALSGIRHAQVLLATHSPIILGLSEPKDLLCFSKNKEGVTDIVLGSQHPMLKDWKKGTNIKDFYAAGILG